jgi:CheY-like chemotaxis protein
MDYEMPIMNGLEATREITSLKKKGEISDIPIIGITAYVNVKNLWMENGMTHFSKSCS